MKKFFSYFAIALTLIFGAALISACGGQDAILGKWEIFSFEVTEGGETEAYDKEFLDEMEFVFDIEFKSGGTISAKINEPEEGTLIFYTGTWEKTGDTYKAYMKATDEILEALFTEEHGEAFEGILEKDFSDLDEDIKIDFWNLYYNEFPDEISDIEDITEEIWDEFKENFESDLKDYFFENSDLENYYLIAIKDNKLVLKNTDKDGEEQGSTMTFTKIVQA